MKKRINIAAIGYLDHGKSTLIGRLLYDTKTVSEEKIKEIRKIQKNKEGLDFALFLDSFIEERKGQFTMDTTQAIFKTKKFEYNFIDCPGHREFIKNMLTGASQAGYAILVVSAKLNEGIEEQAKIQINLAKLLGIRKLFVVINKMDTVNYKEERFLELKAEISRPQRQYMGNGQIKVESKKDMKSRGVESPNLLDGVSMSLEYKPPSKAFSKPLDYPKMSMA